MVNPVLQNLPTMLSCMKG